MCRYDFSLKPLNSSSNRTLRNHGAYFRLFFPAVTLNNGLTFDLSDDDEDEDLGGGGRISKTDDDRPIEAEFKDKQ